jgi:hypothetical protein
MCVYLWQKYPETSIFFLNAVDGKEAKAGKRAENYGVCKG